MIHYATRWAAGLWWQVSGKPSANRDSLYGGAHGLRVLAFHETPPERMPRFKKIIEDVEQNYEIVGPDAVDDLVSGRMAPASRDRILLTFDDGYGSNYAAAEWLSTKSIRAIFFVVPSLVDRTMSEFVAYHRERGVEPYFADSPLAERGLSTEELRRMIGAGHRIAAHNFAHRNLGDLHSSEEIAYEIDQAIDVVESMTGERCEDFAVGFGQPQNLSDEAAKRLQERCRNVYMCFRGLNVPGSTSAFLMRHDVRFTQPDLFHRVAMRCGADHSVADRNEIMISRVGRLVGL